MKQKLYPFSAQKHAHDIDYRRNRAYNELMDGSKDANKLEALIEKLDEIRTLMVGNQKVVWLTGTQYALAIDSVGWAQSQRS